MKKQTLLIIWKWFVALVLIIGLCNVLMMGINKVVESQERDNLERRAYNERLPNVGDMVNLNDEEVVVVKHNLFVGRYTIRYPDGKLSKASEKEFLDIEIIARCKKK
jgi:hypothetical protein